MVAVVQGVRTTNPVILCVLGLSVGIALAAASLPILQQDETSPGIRFTRAPNGHGIEMPPSIDVVHLKGSASFQGGL